MPTALNKSLYAERQVVCKQTIEQILQTITFEFLRLIPYCLIIQFYWGHIERLELPLN